MSDSIVHRWSKRKTQRDDAERTPEAPAAAESAAVKTAAASGEDARSDEHETKELPPIESLDDESDYSAFLSPEVEEGLRKVALRKLFRAPFFNKLDGLNDYDEDFTTFQALGDIVTSDMKFHKERKEAEARQAQEELERKDEPEIDALANEEAPGDPEDAGSLDDETATDEKDETELAQSQDGKRPAS